MIAGSLTWLLIIALPVFLALLFGDLDLEWADPVLLLTRIGEYTSPLLLISGATGGY